MQVKNTNTSNLLAYILASVGNGGYYMNGYVCFYGSKRIEVHAASTYEAQCKTAEQLKVPAKRQYQISVTLAERADGSQGIHTAVD